MTVSVAQSGRNEVADAGHTSTSVAFSSVPTSGSTIMLAVGIDPEPSEHLITTPSGWTFRGKAGTSVSVYTKVAGATEPSGVTISHASTGYTVALLVELSPGAVYDGSAYGSVLSTTTVTVPAVTPTASSDTLLIALGFDCNAYNIGTPSGYGLLEDQVANVSGHSIRMCSWTQPVNPTSGAYSTTAAVVGGTPATTAGVHIAFSGSPPVDGTALRPARAIECSHRDTGSGRQCVQVGRRAVGRRGLVGRRMGRRHAAVGGCHREMGES